MSIRVKLISAFTILTLLLLTLAFVTSRYLENTRKADAVTAEYAELRFTMKSLQFRLAGMSNDERAFLLTTKNEYATEIDAKANEADELLARIKANHLMTEADKAAIDSISGRYEAFREASGKVVQLVRVNDQFAANDLHFGDERAARKALDAEVAAFTDKLNMEIAQDHEERQKDDDMQKLMMYGFFLIGLLLSVVVAVLIIRAIVKPLRAIDSQMKEIADGRGDLSKDLVIRSRDEIGALADTFNRMIRNLRGILGQAQDTAIQVAASSEQLTASAEQTAKATEHIVEATNRIADNSMMEQNNVAAAVTAVQRMSDGIYELSGGNTHISRLAQAASDATSEGTRSALDVHADMQALNETVQQASLVIQSLGNRSQEIQGIAGMITDLAYRTNLLSLNAGIEASRAGEHGRGFAVVAQEIRKLAEESRRSSEQIGSLIEHIVSDTAYAVSAMQSGTHKVSQSLARTADVDRVLHTIDEHVKAVTARVDQSAATTEELAASSRQIVALMEEVQGAGNEVTAACQNNSASTEEQLATMEEISSSSQALSRLAEELNAVLSKFKLQ